MIILSFLYILIAILGITAGILNQQGGYVAESWDWLFYLAGLGAMLLLMATIVSRSRPRRPERELEKYSD